MTNRSPTISRNSLSEPPRQTLSTGIAHLPLGSIRSPLCSDKDSLTSNTACELFLREAKRDCVTAHHTSDQTSISQTVVIYRLRSRWGWLRGDVHREIDMLICEVWLCMDAEHRHVVKEAVDQASWDVVLYSAHRPQRITLSWSVNAPM